MKLTRNISIVLLSLSSIVGVIRGYRMTLYPEGDKILFPYPKGIIQSSVFTNYTIMGWVVFFLVGIFSMLSLVRVIFRMKNYAYFVIIEGVFITFLTVIHILLTGLTVINLIFLPLCIATIVVGILQTPKEF